MTRTWCRPEYRYRILNMPRNWLIWHLHCVTMSLSSRYVYTVIINGDILSLRLLSFSCFFLSDQHLTASLSVYMSFNFASQDTRYQVHRTPLSTTSKTDVTPTILSRELYRASKIASVTWRVERRVSRGGATPFLNRAVLYSMRLDFAIKSRARATKSQV